MLRTNSELRQASANALSGNWGMAAVTTLIYMAVTGVLPNIQWVGVALLILIIPPLEWGMNILFYNLYRDKTLNLGTLLDGFKDYGRVLGTMLLMKVYTFLWTLLLIVPGIIKACSYAMTPYILHEHPELSYDAAIEKSMAMMEGHKMKYFLLYLSFIGWAILCMLTLGIGFLFLTPYMQTSYAAFYEDLKAESETTYKETAQA